MIRRESGWRLHPKGQDVWSQGNDQVGRTVQVPMSSEPRRNELMGLGTSTMLTHPRITRSLQTLEEGSLLIL